jgi:dTMP kinase
MMIATDPDLTLILDMDPDASLGRSEGKAAARSLEGAPAENRFERRGSAFQAQIRRSFLAIAAAEPGRCRVLDAARPVEAVADDIWRAVAARLGL